MSICNLSDKIKHYYISRDNDGTGYIRNDNTKVDICQPSALIILIKSYL